jgi:cell wall-associated NlpC family hydrolase
MSFSTRVRIGAASVAVAGAFLLPLGVSTSAQAVPVAAAAPASVHVTAAARPATVAPKLSAKALAARVFAAKSARVIRVAASLKGRPYRYGASGPRAFDCSGYVMYVMHKALGARLPHNAAAQYHRVHKISTRSARPGDLVFYHSRGGHVYHVAIYAGHGLVWQAAHPGTRIKKSRISGRVTFGRII